MALTDPAAAQAEASAAAREFLTRPTGHSVIANCYIKQSDFRLAQGRICGHSAGGLVFDRAGMLV
ncbi:hypothetical protein [Variovorax terrae]|uniref:Uncharacterized protein n=1 Tax=Variovorax terrae TaxID=2923278 RepID=A0A9X1VY96_9BURK|nr:hypothetical protein [Variovorax terrae]MCJ0762773.1 hypothetical protein [Variovorax terrae]